MASPNRAQRRQAERKKTVGAAEAARARRREEAHEAPAPQEQTHPLEGADPDAEEHDIGKVSIRQLLMMRQFFTHGSFSQPRDKIAAGQLQERIVEIVGPEPPLQGSPPQ
jgi:hypothetical protein